MSISKNVYINKLDVMVNEYKNTYHRTIKMRPVDVKENTYIESMELRSNKKTNDEDPKFKVGDYVRIFLYKSIFAKGYTPNWSGKVFVITKFKDTNDLNGEKIVGIFYEKKLQKTSRQEL